ncbi:hypothetical protein GPECTOR_2g1040 [Gonium pectorale]|uniref:EGF-like domain-containing protein n=1 Tax=Gonium pectorale TaxID=33097 RepID=A0A150H079_GONPE|nr:hypothetical protein GPECTOR_2g1040 [Gonium pectorale]|eukprot:KXZ55491.1 hypothetical protein GPECTOR_2g1040 [Gonium pectorale]
MMTVFALNLGARRCDAQPWKPGPCRSGRQARKARMMQNSSVHAWANRQLLLAERSLVVTNGAGAPRTVASGGQQSELEEAKAALRTDASDRSGSGSGGSVSDLEQRLRARPSRCPGECTKYGTCNEELGRCDCPLGRNGTDCSGQLPGSDLATLCARFGHTGATCGRELELTSCLNACNFRGTCLTGFCHCRPGFFGADCSLSLSLSSTQESADGGREGADARPAVEILAGQDYKPRLSGPRIYVYELPPSFNVYGSLERLDRPLMYMIWQRLLSAGLRVADPADADFFFVPVRARAQYDSQRVLDAVSYMSATWPHWNATGGGGRHLFIHTGDWGRDELTEEAAAATRGASWLTHWGLARPHEFAGWAAAHRPGTDIVLPMVLQASVLSSYRLTRASPLHPAGPRRPRPNTLFFAGRVCGSRASPSTNGSFPNCPNVLGKEDAYSAATRQRAFYHHHNRTGWKVLTHSRSYASDMLASKFCLSPSGGGPSKRSVVAPLLGCVPVTVTDGLLQPFEPEMAWERFAVDIRERDIPVMHRLLEGLDGGQLGAFQERLRCAAQHLFWSSLYGGVFGEDGRYDAFETLAQILRMRAAYPNLAPEEYAYVDPAFAAFINCQEPPPPQEQQEEQQQKEQAPASPLSVGQALAVSAGVASSSTTGGGRDWAGGAGWLLDIAAKPELRRELVRVAAAAGRGGTGSRQAGPAARPAPVPRPTPAGAKQALCSHSELPTPQAATCSRCVRRKGRLLNPGGTICCNTKDLAKCPRLWD